jgi:hypothetical protein
MASIIRMSFVAGKRRRVMAKKTQRSPRMTITVPFELRARIEAVDQDINWSAVAARAFQDKLAEIAAKKVRKEMSDVIQRLRASKRRAEDEESQQGYEDGRQWAEDRAEAEQLERLDDLVRGSDWDRFFDGDSAYSWGDHLVWVMDADEHGGRYRTKEFWETVAGDNDYKLSSNEAYIRGFADGALSVWDAVKDKL